MAFPFIMSGFFAAAAAKALKVNDGSLEKKLIFKAISGYISHKAACRRGIGNCPALIIFFYFEVILRKNGTFMVYKDTYYVMYMICNNSTPFST